MPLATAPPFEAEPPTLTRDRGCVAASGDMLCPDNRQLIGMPISYSFGRPEIDRDYSAGPEILKLIGTTRQT